MQERIVEIIVYLVKELQANKRLHDVDMSSLTKDGYTQSEISTAFSWIFERMITLENMTKPSSAGDDSHRQLNDTERQIIRPDAYGYLLQCRQLGLLGNDEVESVIDRIMGSGLPALGLSDMKSLVAGHLFDPERTDWTITFGSNDTIH
jgi:uncharacterized protein Smg (DUF494 family)